MNSEPSTENTKRKSRAKKPNENTLIEELRVMHAQGLLVSAPIWGIPGMLVCCEVKAPFSWGELAMNLSLNLSGQVWVGGQGLTYVCGKQPIWVAPYGKLQGIKEARAICQAFTGLPDVKIPCSAAGVARRLLAHCGISQDDSGALDSIGAQQHWAYQYCEPTILENGYLHDIEACYFTLLKRAPSPKVILLAGKLRFCPIERDERYLWEKMLELAAPHKGVRNSFIGQMYAKGDGTYFFDGRCNKNASDIDLVRRTQEAIDNGLDGLHLDDLAEDLTPKKQKHGPLRPLACLIVRSAYELCAMAQQYERAIYSNTDCVITTSHRTPEVWARYGLTVSTKHSGQVETNAIGYYKVGTHETLPYKASVAKGHKRAQVWAGNDNETQAKVRLIMAGKCWLAEWLKPVVP